EALLDGNRRSEVEARVGRGRQLVVVLRTGNGPDLRRGDRVAVPAADVALDGLRIEALLADALDQHRERHLPLAEPGDLDAAGEIGRCVFDRVTDVGARD